MRDDLLGYLLGALDPEDYQRVEQYLQTEPDAARELAALRRAIEPLEADNGHLSPPPDLCRRTCRHVGLDSRRTRSELTASPAAGWRMRDVLVAAGVCCGALLLVVPAIRLSRDNDRIAHCADNLRQLGVAFHEYSETYGYLPYVPAEGPLAFAGVFAPSLHDAGLLEDGTPLRCPGSPPQGEQALVGISRLLEAAEAEAAELRARLGGAYAYTLGFVQDGRYHPITDQRRPYFAILGDRPPRHCGPDDTSRNHGCDGQNVLFEDGHVEWIRGCRHPSAGDNFFRNHQGAIGAGDGPEDAVLVRSDVAPF